MTAVGVPTTMMEADHFMELMVVGARKTLTVVLRIMELTVVGEQ